MPWQRYSLLASSTWRKAGSRIELTTLLCAVLLWALLLPGCARQPSTPVSPEPADVLVQGAEMTELGPLLDALEDRQEFRIGTWFFWEGRIGEKRVVVSLTEVGPMNASAATALAIERWHPRVILNQGTSGAHDERLQIRDIVLGVKNVDFGAFKMSPAGRGEGVALGRINPTTTKLRLGPDGDRIAFQWFPSSPDLVEQALKTPYEKGRVLAGVVGTAHQWNREIDRIEWLRTTYGTDTEDMESAYVAAVAYAFRIPFLSVRIVSDNEFHSPEFIRSTGEDCAAFVLDVIRSLDLEAVAPVEHGAEFGERKVEDPSVREAIPLPAETAP